MAAGLAVAATALLIGPATAGAAPGELDPTFGVDGRYFAQIGCCDGAPDIAVDSQGRTLAVFSDVLSSAGVIRVLADGGTDESFGTGGIARSSGHTHAVAVAVDGLDRVVIAAHFSRSSGVVAAGLLRLNAQGDLDDDFDGNGSRGIGAIVPTALEARPDGRILYQGDAGDQTGNALVVVQLNADGSRNTSFGTNGRAVIPLPAGASNARLTEISIGSGGNVAVLGTYTSAAGNTRRAVGMLTPGGDLDPGFAGTGVITMSEAWRSLAADSTGGVLMTREYSESSTPGRTIVVRLGSDGQLDTGFGSAGGMAVNAIPTWDDLPQDIDIGPDGQIAVTGGGSAPGESDFFSVIQLTADGLPDAGFGQNGVFWDVSGRPPEGAFDPAGNIVATQGPPQPATGVGIRLTRLQGSGSSTDDPGNGGGSGGVAGDVAASGRGLRIHKFVSPRTLAGIAARGMRAQVSCTLACRAVLKVKVPLRTAQEMGLRTRVIARGSRTIGADRRRWMVLKLTPQARPALRAHSGRISFKLTGRGLAA